MQEDRWWAPHLFIEPLNSTKELIYQVWKISNPVKRGECRILYHRFGFPCLLDQLATLRVFIVIDQIDRDGALWGHKRMSLEAKGICWTRWEWACRRLGVKICEQIVQAFAKVGVSMEGAAYSVAHCLSSFGSAIPDRANESANAPAGSLLRWRTFFIFFPFLRQY